MRFFHTLKKKQQREQCNDRKTDKRISPSIRLLYESPQERRERRGYLARHGEIGKGFFKQSRITENINNNGSRNDRAPRSACGCQSPGFIEHVDILRWIVMLSARDTKRKKPTLISFGIACAEHNNPAHAIPKEISVGFFLPIRSEYEP